MNTALQHPSTPASPPLEFGPYRLDRAQARLTRDGHPLALVGRAFDLLCALAERPQTLVEKDDLLDAVWGHRHVTESSLKGAINTLRLALGDDAKVPRFVETVPRRGYRFIAEVKRGAESAAPEPSAPPQRRKTDVATPTPAGGNLPYLPEPLVGRGAELTRLQHLLAQHRLVTLTGLGGVGKTRLALSAAALAEPPVWLLRLDELSDAHQLLPALAQHLQLGPEAATAVPALARALSRERCLLVLDNAEHLLEAVSKLCGELLAQAPQLRLLVTSQAPLRLGPEVVLPLGPLGLPPQRDGAAPEPEEGDAMRLLVARIRHHTPGWEPGPRDAEPLAALCRALDGLPLALELAAARVPLLGLAGVRQRLDHNLALLNRGSRDAAARHHSLVAALDWTFSLLSEGERQALQQLAVFAGTFSIEACEGVLGPEALDQVEELRARSLLVVEHATTGMRLRMFETVRHHALQALRQSGQEDQARERLLSWLGERLQGLWWTDATCSQESWLPQFSADLDNLRATLRHALAAQATATVRRQGLLLAMNSSPLWQRLGWLAEGWQWLAEARAQVDALIASDAGRPEDAWLRQRLDLACADYCATAQQGDAREAAARLPPLLADPRIQADPALHFHARRADFWLRVRLGFGPDPEAPRRACDALQAACLPHWPELTQRWWMRAEANVCRVGGDFEGALRWVERHTALCRRHGALANAHSFLYLPLQMLGLLGRWDEACHQAREQVQELLALGALRQYPFNAATAAAVLLRSSPLGLDRPHVIQTLRLLADLQQLWWLADALPWAAWHQGRPDDARRLQTWADGLVHQRGEKRGPFFGSLRRDLLASLEPAPEPDEPTLLAAAQTPIREILDLALGAGTALTVLAPN